MSNNRKTPRLQKLAVVTAAASIGFTAVARAAVDSNWVGTTSNAFGTSTNWTPTATPGVGGGAVPNGTAMFNGSAALVNNNTTIATGGGTIALGVLKFDTATAAAYQIGSSVGDGTFTLSGNGGTAVNMTSTVANDQVIDSNIGINVAGIAFVNASTTSSLTINGTVSGVLASPDVLTLTGPGSGTINGAITNGTATNLGMTIGSGIWTLNSSSSTFSGAAFTSANDGVTGYTKGVQMTGGTLVIGSNASTSTGGSIGEGTLILSGATIQAGGGDRQINNTVLMNNGSATFSGSNGLALNGTFVFSGTGTITNSISTSGKTLNIGGDVHIRDAGSSARTVTFAGNGTTVIGGTISNGLGTAAGSLTVGAAGNTGTLKLNGGNTYTGATSVTVGSTLLENGTHTVTTVGNYTISGTLGGTGSITPSGTNKVTIASGGTLAAGDSTLAAAAQTGSLDIGNSIAFSNNTSPATSNFNVQLGGAMAGGGTSFDGAGFYDQVNMTNSAGTVALGTGVNLNLGLVNNFTPTTGNVFYILTRADTTTGATATNGWKYGNTFAGLAEGATFSFGTNGTAQITYQANWTGTQGGSSVSGGNDIALYNVVVPEPASLAAMGLAATGLLARRRKQLG